MSDEMAAMQENKTHLPPGKRAIGYSWVYTIKYKSDGILERLKA